MRHIIYVKTKEILKTAKNDKKSQSTIANRQIDFGEQASFELRSPQGISTYFSKTPLAIGNWVALELDLNRALMRLELNVCLVENIFFAEFCETSERDELFMHQL